MLSKIEELVLGGNIAHDLVSLEKTEKHWVIVVSPTYEHELRKKFKFKNVHEKYEQDLTEENEVLEYPLPITGFDSKLLPNGLWQFCLNASEIEWSFISEWPENA